MAEKKNANSLATTSVYTDKATAQRYVFVPSEDGQTALRQNVAVGFENNDYAEITQGLRAGQKVIAFAYGLKDGSKIHIK